LSGIKSVPRILIAGGGTGGHIIPALAVARELVARHAAEILFVGTSRGMESRMVPAAGFALKFVEIGPLNQVSWATRLKTLVGLPFSLVTCSQYIKEFKADVVFGVGGYASGPAMQLFCGVCRRWHLNRTRFRGLRIELWASESGRRQ